MSSYQETDQAQLQPSPFTAFQMGSEMAAVPSSVDLNGSLPNNFEYSHQSGDLNHPARPQHLDQFISQQQSVVNLAGQPVDQQQSVGHGVGQLHINPHLMGSFVGQQQTAVNTNSQPGSRFINPSPRDDNDQTLAFSSTPTSTQSQQQTALQCEFPSSSTDLPQGGRESEMYANALSSISSHPNVTHRNDDGTAESTVSRRTQSAEYQPHTPPMSSTANSPETLPQN